MPTDIRTVIDILRKLVSFDTVSSNPNRALIDWARDYLKSFGVESEIVASADGTKASLWTTIGAGSGGIALGGHTDVVPVEGQSWSSNPFDLIERDGKLYGRGSCDMKGFIACALAFVPEFLAAKTEGCFHIALTSDEETDMTGAQRLADYLIAKKIKPDWVWIGEPTLLTIVNQHKGVAAYRTRFTGVPGHSGQPDKGLNAIELAADYMQIIRDLAAEKAALPYAPSRFDPAYSTLNLGVVQGGHAENILAENCDLTWQVRAYPGETAAAMQAEIDRRAGQNFAARFKKFPQAGFSFCACHDIPPFLATADNPGEKTLKRLLSCDETFAASFATEAGIFQKSGAGVVVCGPGSIEQAHQPNEFIDKSQLTACVDLMRRTLLSSLAS